PSRPTGRRPRGKTPSETRSATGGARIRAGRHETRHQRRHERRHGTRDDDRRGDMNGGRVVGGGSRSAAGGGPPRWGGGGGGRPAGAEALSRGTPAPRPARERGLARLEASVDAIARTRVSWTSAVAAWWSARPRRLATAVVAAAVLILCSLGTSLA